MHDDAVPAQGRVARYNRHIGILKDSRQLYASLPYPLEVRRQHSPGERNIYYKPMIASSNPPCSNQKDPLPYSTINIPTPYAAVHFCHRAGCFPIRRYVLLPVRQLQAQKLARAGPSGQRRTSKYMYPPAIVKLNTGIHDDKWC